VSVLDQLPRVTRPVVRRQRVASRPDAPFGWFALDPVSWTKAGPYPTLEAAYAYARSTAEAHHSNESEAVE
jgi:hypothetical protein